MIFCGLIHAKWKTQSEKTSEVIAMRAEPTMKASKENHRKTKQAMIPIPM
jgi:hypothetical protein